MPDRPGPDTAQQVATRAAGNSGNGSPDSRPGERPREKQGTWVLMIADDHEPFRRAIRNWLVEFYPDCELLDAATGEEAVAQAGTRDIRIVLMDIRLPGIDGIEATRRIKALSPRSEVIMLTNHDELPLRQAAAEAGASAYVVKSRASQDLEPKIEAALKHTTGNAHAAA